MATQIKLRRDTAANWLLEDPILAEGEPGFETDTGKLKIGDGSNIWSALGYVTDTITIPTPGAIAQGAYEVSINTLGNVAYPGAITQSFQRGTSCPATVDTVVYTSTGPIQHAIKLFVMVEGFTDGGGVSWDTQACDVIAVKGYNDNIVHVTTYGVTYSGSAAIATFDGQWNATTSKIEITCRPVSVTNDVTVSVHAIEMTSND
jgi:hypothetical protein